MNLIKGPCYVCRIETEQQLVQGRFSCWLCKLCTIDQVLTILSRDLK